MANSTGTNPEVLAINQERSLALAGIFATLSPREEKVMRLRYGLEGDGLYTLQEIADEFAVTRNRVWQIERKAISKLRCRGRAWWNEKLYRD